VQSTLQSTDGLDWSRTSGHGRGGARSRGGETGPRACALSLRASGRRHACSSTEGSERTFAPSQSGRCRRDDLEVPCLRGAAEVGVGAPIDRHEHMFAATGHRTHAATVQPRRSNGTLYRCRVRGSGCDVGRPDAPGPGTRSVACPCGGAKRCAVDCESTDGVGLASSEEGRGPVQGGVDRAPRAVRCSLRTSGRRHASRRRIVDRARLRSSTLPAMEAWSQTMTNSDARPCR
jgi:hypothetical protein